ncbi:MAG: DNA polymerase III subunit delta [Thiotrichaceae bacterium]
MKLRIEQLSQYLKNSSDRVFFISGNEPLQMMEATDQIRQAAQMQGYDERDIISFEGGKADWSVLTAASIELSLFSQKKMLDVRLLGSSPGAKGSKAIRDYLENIPEDKVLLLQTGKLDKSSRNSAWVKALDKYGVMIQVWDLSPAQTLAWVAKRMRNSGLQPTQEAVRLLTERIEGNLLAADQEIKKLVLLFGQKSEQSPVDVDQVMQVVADSSRFSVFDLSDAVLLGDIKRLHHMLDILREEGTPLPLILWSISTLSRQLHDMCYRITLGESESQAMQVAGFIPQARKALFPQAIRRLKQADWSYILQQNFIIESMSKGQGETRIRDESRIWDAMLDCAVSLTGKQLVS